MKQRGFYYDKIRGKKSSLSDERQEKLNEIGFCWVAPHVAKTKAKLPLRENIVKEQLKSHNVKAGGMAVELPNCYSPKINPVVGQVNAAVKARDADAIPTLAEGDNSTTTAVGESSGEPPASPTPQNSPTPSNIYYQYHQQMQQQMQQIPYYPDATDGGAAAAPTAAGTGMTQGVFGGASSTASTNEPMPVVAPTTMVPHATDLEDVEAINDPTASILHSVAATEQYLTHQAPTTTDASLNELLQQQAPQLLFHPQQQHQEQQLTGTIATASVGQAAASTYPYLDTATITTNAVPGITNQEQEQLQEHHENQENTNSAVQFFAL